MSLPVLTAVVGEGETELVTGLERAAGEVTVVRRCVDLPDLLAAAVTGQARAVVLSAALRRLDGEALTRLMTAGLAVVALIEPGDEAARRRLRQLGVDEVLPAGSPAEEVASAIGRAVAADDRRRHQSPSRARSTGGDPSAADLAVAERSLADPAAALTAMDRHDAADRTEGDGAAGAMGRLVTVWGPTGAPGRTTVAVTLAAELARLGQSTVLADADTYGGSVAQVLGLLDEAPGLAAATRAADHGTHDLAQPARLAPIALPGLRVLTGISRPERWPELRGPALARVLETARRLAAWTVVDCGFGIETDEELSSDLAAPRRNAATLITLDRADTVLAVGSADPVGLQRLVRALGELAEQVPTVAPVVVVNRVRGSAVGGGPDSLVRAALARYAGVAEPVLVPDDRPALDAALLAGRTLTELAPASPARLALAALARSVAGLEPSPEGTRWRGGARRFAAGRTPTGRRRR